MSIDLIERWSTAAQAYLDGDLRTYARLAHHTADYTLIPPNGGDPELRLVHRHATRSRGRSSRGSSPRWREASTP